MSAPLPATPHQPVATGGGLAGAFERGRAALLDLTQDGTLRSAADFAARLGVSTDDLTALVARGDLFSVDVQGEKWYLDRLLSIAQKDVAALCQALAGESDAGKLIFFLRDHGALAGQTVAEAVAAGMLERVLELGRAWRGR